MKKIIFLHGFFATGSCPMALALRDALVGRAVVLTPDLPLHPPIMSLCSLIVSYPWRSYANAAGNKRMVCAVGDEDAWRIIDLSELQPADDYGA